MGSVLRVLEGIAQEVEQCPFHQVHIGLHFQGIRADETQFLIPGCLLKSAHPFPNGSAEVKAGKRERESTAFYLSEIQDVVHQPQQHVHISAYHLKRLLLCRFQFIGHHPVQRGRYQRQGRTQIVAYAGKEF